MHHPQEQPWRFTLRGATLDDFDFSEALTRTNMSPYYRRHGLVWHGLMFLGSWKESENFMVEAGGSVVGVLRLNKEGDALHIRDVQILPAWRGLGAGTFVLRTVHGWARIRRCKVLQLRVFYDNPAAALYRRLGYRVLDVPDPEFASILRMECPV